MAAAVPGLLFVPVYFCTCLLPTLLLTLIQCQLLVQVAPVGSLSLWKGPNTFQVPFQHTKFLLADGRHDGIRRRARSEVSVCGHVGGTDTRRTWCPLRRPTSQATEESSAGTPTATFTPHPGLLTQQAPRQAHSYRLWAPTPVFTYWLPHLLGACVGGLICHL